MSRLDDVVFLAFLESEESPADLLGKLTRCAQTDSPGGGPIAHVELVIPATEGQPTQFATYVNERARWQTSIHSYYTNVTRGRWRAIPVVFKNAARLVRKECNRINSMSPQMDYSYLKYLTAFWAVRPFVPHSLISKLENACPSIAHHHCASLCSLVLRNSSTPSCVPARHPSYYSPTALCHEAMRVFLNSKINILDRMSPKDASYTLVHGRELDISEDIDLLWGAILAMVAGMHSNKTGSDTEHRNQQRTLATALLRVCRRHEWTN